MQKDQKKKSVIEIGKTTRIKIGAPAIQGEFSLLRDFH